MTADLLKYAHFLGLALGLGLTLHADMRFLRLLVVRISPAELATIRQFHVHIATGLVVLWVTGLALILVRTGGDLAAMPDKVFVKVMLATVLTANAVMIGRTALPLLAAGRGLRYGEMDRGARLVIASVGALSVASWTALLALGTGAAFRTMAAPDILDLAALWYALCFAGALTLALAAPLACRARGSEDHMTMTLASSGTRS